jgi:hypothetical protein
MTRDYIEDLEEHCEKEGKLYVIAVFDDDMKNVFTTTNIDKHSSGEFIYPGGKKETAREAIARGIAFALTGKN